MQRNRATLLDADPQGSAVRRALEGRQRELVVHDADGANAAPASGRIAGKGLANELKRPRLSGGRRH
ncbi:MAG: hypothetical protein ABJA77_13555 [Variovorax sp.]